MTNLDLSNLRPWLDNFEEFACSILPMDPGFAVAQQMLEIIAIARASLVPSVDSTANFVPNKDIIERLSRLRSEVENRAEDGRGGQQPI